MEHRRRPERIPRRPAGIAAGPSSSGVLRRYTEDGHRFDFPDPGSLPGRAQHSGGNHRRGGRPDDSQRAQPVLRAAEHDQQLDAQEPPGGKSKRGGDPPQRDLVFEHLNTAVIILDQNHLIEDMNPAAENLLGMSEHRARGQPLMQLLGDDTEFQDILNRTLESGVTYANEMKLGRTEAHAGERMIDCRVSLLQEPPKKARLLVEMTDVTRRSRISRENALLIQHGAGRQMIRQLAHEIKNPLGGLRGAAQLLDRQLDSEELKEYTSVIISEADRLASLVDTLLGPGGPPNKQPLNVHELLEYVVRLIEPGQERIHIRRDYDPGLPIFLLDRDQMVQAFLNLLQNAITALDGQGEITLRTRAIMNFTIGDIRHSAVASIEIEDDGPGIPQDLQDSIFYPLVTSRPDGTGLGLPAAQELISRHGGLIEFESRPGQTVFFVRIPLTEAEANLVG